MTLTGAALRASLAEVRAVGKQIRSFDELAAGADAALRQAPAGLTNAGAASFLATCAQESDYFRTTREYGSGQWYAPWIGRGFVQVTHEANYRGFGEWCHARGLIDRADLFVRARSELEDFRWAWLTAVWYFEVNGLWTHANRGDHYAVSQGVNRGRGAIGTSKVPNHWTQRRAMFDAFRARGGDLLPAGLAAAQAAAGIGGGTYTVARGDTLSSIAARHPGVTWQDLARANALPDPDRLQLGQVLRIPGPAPAHVAPAGAPAPQEDDLPTPADVWQHPIDDPYTPQAGDTQPAHVIMAWLGANAAHAANASRAALTELAAMRVAVDRLAAALGTASGVDPASLQQAVREGVAQALAESVQVTGQLTVTPKGL